MRWLVVFAAACSFEPGTLPTIADAPKPSIDARVIDSPAIDAVTVDARQCPPAPTNCVSFQCASSTSCYYLCGTATTGKQNYAGAVTSCTNASLGCIVTINDQMENDCIRDTTIPDFPDSMVWIGWEQANGASEPAGGWSWRCGSSGYTAPNWDNGDPMGEPTDTGSGEDCATMIEGGAWLDVTCNGSSRFVCELP